MDVTDVDLVRRSRQGDRKAFELIVDRHAPGLHRLACLTLGQADAQDVVQETLLAAFTGLDRFRGQSSPRTWLVGILMKQIARHRRHEGRRRTAPLDDHTADHRQHQSRSEARMDIADLLAKLSPEHRDVVVLRELEGLSYDELATALELPRGTVESRLFRARQALRLSAGESP